MEGTIWGDDALDTMEASAYLGYRPIFTVAALQGMEGIPAQRVGGNTVFLKPDLDKWMAERKRRSDPSYYRGMA